MNNTASVELEEANPILTREIINFNWKTSPSVHKLLDVVSSIIAAEYVSVAKQNPKLFLKQGITK